MFRTFGLIGTSCLQQRERDGGCPIIKNATLQARIQIPAAPLRLQHWPAHRSGWSQKYDTGRATSSAAN
jgi:hypothetical protein